MEKIIKSVILSALFLALADTGTVRADEAIPDLSMESVPTDELSMDAEPKMHGRIESTGIYFEVKDSEWLNVSLSSSELIKLTLESVPNMITMHVEAAAGAASTQITIKGLAPDTTYHKYEDNYHNHEAFTTDDNGNYTYTQDLFIPHMVFIQTHKSTKFIKDDGTGGDCYSIGIWDSPTKTCTMTMDLNETIQIDSDGVTLYGNGHTLTGSYTGYGVYLSGRTEVTVKNFNISRFSSGISMRYSNSNIITGNTLSDNGHGVSLSSSNGNILSNNTVSDNKLYITSAGISFYYYSGHNTISNNTVFKNRRGIVFWPGTGGNNILLNNDVSNNYVTGIDLWSSDSQNNILINNTCNSNDIGIRLGASSTTLKGNTMTGNRYNFGIIGEVGPDEDIDTSNTVDGKPIYFIKNASNQTFDASTNAGTFYCFSCSNVTLEGLNLSKNFSGVFFYNTNNSTIRNTTVSKNGTGVYMYASDNNTIYNNNFIGNSRQATVSGGSNNIFNLSSPIGGNYWSDWTTPDADGDGFVDNPYVFTGGQDNLPWTKQDGWKPSDSTPPTTTASLSGTPGNNGWYLSDVQVTLTATDNEGGSGVAKTEYSFDGTNWITYTAPVTVSAEGATTVYYRSTDSAENAETAKSLTVSIDKTPPTITETATTLPNAYGWYNADVTVHFTASDNMSGINSVTPDITISSEGANQSATGTAFDKAGNSATATVSGINIDKTTPIITITSPLATQYDRSVTININFTATDSVSGVYKTTAYLDGQQYDPAKPVSLLYLSLGIHTLKVEAENYAGLMATQSVDFEIIATAGGTTSLVTTLYQTGAIDSAGIATSLTQQLQAAQAAISSGQTASAQNILEAFINMLEAQSGKHISSSAAETLMADALYLIGQL